MTPAEVRARLSRIAEADIGFCESEGPNAGPLVRRFQRATWKSPGPWPWCAAFLASCLEEWLLDPEARALVKAPDEPIALDRWRLREPGARLVVPWARRRLLHVLEPFEPLEPGDLVVYDFAGRDGIGDHCGIAFGEESPGGAFEAIEGNTDSAGGREGNGVWCRSRYRSRVLQAVRLERVGP